MRLVTGLFKYILFPVLATIITLSINLTSTGQIKAQSIGDYFDLDYNMSLSKTSIVGSETFTVTATGSAVCKQNLPMTVKQVTLTSKIIAVNQSNNTSVELNPEFTLVLGSASQPFPNKPADLPIQKSEVVPLQFPAGSESGTYSVKGELLTATATTVLGPFPIPITMFPPPPTIGSITYQAGGPGGPGGGIGGIVPPSPTQSSTVVPAGDISFYIDSDGKFTRQLTVQSLDKKCQLEIKLGVLGLTGAGQPITSLTISEIETPPDPPSSATYTSPVYEMGPRGTTFDPAITVIMTYDPAQVPPWVDVNTLVLAYWNEETQGWVRLKSVVDPQKHTVTAAISHFTRFAVLAYHRASAFQVSGLTITPLEAKIGEKVVISAYVTNSGDIAGYYEASLEINGKVAETQKLTLEGGEKKQVTFTVLTNEAGSYPVTLGETTGGFIVRKPVSTPVTPPTTPPAVIPAAFTFNNLSISPARPQMGEPVTVSAQVTNTGSAAGICRVAFQLNNISVEQREINLTGGESQQVSFTVTPNNAGEYSVAINTVSGSFSVVTDTPPLPLPPINWWLIGGTIIAIAVVCGIITSLIISRRKV